MWRSLSLRSLGVIESAQLELEAGFTVITGETGAGKTMVVTALGLLRGDRSDSGLVRHGADQARVEAVVVADRPIAALVVDAGGEIDDGELVLARTLSAQGRSRAHAGGATVPAALLAEITDQLVAVHGQSEQHRLRQPAEQRAALDAFAGEPLGALLREYGPMHAHWRGVRQRLETLRTEATERARELDMLRHGLAEFEAVEPQPGEDEQLLAEEQRLTHAESLVQAAASAHAALAGDAESVGAVAARDLAVSAGVALDAAAGHDADLDAMGGRVREVVVLLDELAADLNAYAASVEQDPARLADVQQRRAALISLQRKYGPSLADALAWRAKAVDRVGELGGDDQTVAELDAELATLGPELRDLAGRITAVRAAAAGRLAEQVAGELAALAMPAARLEVRVRSDQHAEPGPHGVDEVEFLFAANSGAGLRPLHKAASGGELSRVMLALEVILAEGTAVPTFVFDEVDAGIGGKAAVEVGRRLARLAGTCQVIAVTHLPQVAAFADHHFRVLKDDDGTVTSSSVIGLDADGRVDELARMLAGHEDSTAARDHARELLQLAADSG